MTKQTQMPGVTFAGAWSGGSAGRKQESELAIFWVWCTRYYEMKEAGRARGQGCGCVKWGAQGRQVRSLRCGRSHRASEGRVPGGSGESQCAGPQEPLEGGTEGEGTEGQARAAIRAWASSPGNWGAMGELWAEERGALSVSSRRGRGSSERTDLNWKQVNPGCFLQNGQFSSTEFVRCGGGAVGGAPRELEVKVR